MPLPPPETFAIVDSAKAVSLAASTRRGIIAMCRVKLRAIDAALVLSPMLLYVAVAISYLGAAAATVHPVDYLVLQSLRRSLYDLPGSAYFASWDFTDDPCGFAGVVCSGDRVVALALGDPRAGASGLAGRLPPSLSLLPALAELSLVPGRVTGPLPPSFPPGLRFLAVSGNLLSGPVPASIASLRFLRTLDLGSNLLSGELPEGLLCLPALETLVLAHNRISGGLPAYVSAPLLRLDLRDNVFSGNIPALPPSLRYLSLPRNRLSGSVDQVLCLLPRLNYLDISMNRLSGAVPGVIFTFSISTFRLQKNLFSGTLRPSGPLAVAGATVDLSSNMLTGEVPAELAPAERLYLNSNGFTGELPAALVQQVASGAMRVLYVQHNYLTGFSTGAPPVFPAGSSVCLSYNCMVPLANTTTCPRKAGPQKARPPAECASRQKRYRLKGDRQSRASTP